MQGTVKRIDKLHPYGWISPSEGNRKIFFHQKTLAPCEAFPSLGDFVVFQISFDTKGRPCATGVRKASATAKSTDNAVRFGDMR